MTRNPAAELDMFMIHQMQDVVYKACEAGVVDEEFVDDVFANEPRSHTFVPSFDEPWDEDDFEAVAMVGEGDRLAKLKYWRNILLELPEGTMTRFSS
ncbi:hypothetical protein SEA_CHERRYONLIM_32 [Gordonia phage CherryonLim]|uniref:Uncharacterized protein n=1 Tax=Gordonia phage CherryonLim TaxID=2652411 RepID=A0A5P8D9W0_9CAUD|nr:hypothetical protein PP994_gp32 [Gordonia phage CherryonLim]QFP95785.1 hypothetical protein SEA_CHERRYONLIM_32 [Gordonia phage CherryonLim]